MARQELNPEATDLKFANHGNHSKAQMATTDLVVDKLKSISAPTLVIHGYEDPIFLPKHAEEIAKAIPHSKLVIIENMGHALTPLFFDPIIRNIIDHTDKN